MEDIEKDIENLAKPKKAGRALLHTAERAGGMIMSDAISEVVPIKGGNGLVNDVVHTLAGGIGTVALKKQKDLKNISEGVFLNGTKNLFKRGFDWVKAKLGKGGSIGAFSFKSVTPPSATISQQPTGDLI